MPNFTITALEDGQKLICAISRRTGESFANIRRWIRTGQVRVDGSRKKEFDRVVSGNSIRLPPFVNLITNDLSTSKDISKDQDRDGYIQKLINDVNEHFKVVYIDSDIMIINKPKGIPVQCGSKHDYNSIASELKKIFSKSPFIPAPAHRLDKDTSGLLCIGISYKGLRMLSDAFANHTVIKEYLAWCIGNFKFDGIMETKLTKSTITDTIQTQTCKIEKVVEDESSGKQAKMYVRTLMHANGTTLVHFRLITGRMHQIRVQMTNFGHPIIGDGKYGGKTAYSTNPPPISMLLHSLRISINAISAEVLPPWNPPWKVDKIPPPFLL